MNNPWAITWTAPDYVLDTDRATVESFNGKANLKDEHRIRLGILPEPFLGRIDAPVVLLSLNPGYSPDDVRWHNDQKFRERSLRNLRHANDSAQPFYLLDPAIANSGGGIWWRKRTAQGRQACEDRIGHGNGDAAVANGLLCVEYFPYHSVRFAGASLKVSSQEYGFHLVRRAMERNALIVVLRSRNTWHAEIPELKDYPRYYILQTINGKTPQTPYLTKHLLRDRDGNRTGFNAVVDAICSHAAAITASA